MTRIYDVVHYRGEADLLKKRVALLRGLVNTFYVVEEESKTPLRDEESEWLKAHEDVVSYHLVGEDPLGYAIKKIGDLQPHLQDIIMLSDTGEIPHPLAVDEVASNITVYQAVTLNMQKYVYDWTHASPRPWPGTVITMYKWMIMSGLGPNYFRQNRGGFHFVEGTGWNLRYFGGAEGATADLLRHPLPEQGLDREKALAQVKDRLSKHVDPFGRATELLVETNGVDHLQVALDKVEKKQPKP